MRYNTQNLICPSCGNRVKLQKGKDRIVCEYCNNLVIVNDTEDNRGRYDRLLLARKHINFKEYSKALIILDKLIIEDEFDIEAHIEYIIAGIGDYKNDKYNENDSYKRNPSSYNKREKILNAYNRLKKIDEYGTYKKELESYIEDIKEIELIQNGSKTELFDKELSKLNQLLRTVWLTNNKSYFLRAESAFNEVFEVQNTDLTTCIWYTGIDYVEMDGSLEIMNNTEVLNIGANIKTPKDLEMKTNQLSLKMEPILKDIERDNKIKQNKEVTEKAVNKVGKVAVGTARGVATGFATYFVCGLAAVIVAALMGFIDLLWYVAIPILVYSFYRGIKSGIK